MTHTLFLLHVTGHFSFVCGIKVSVLVEPYQPLNGLTEHTSRLTKGSVLNTSFIYLHPARAYSVLHILSLRVTTPGSPRGTNNSTKEPKNPITTKQQWNLSGVSTQKLCILWRRGGEWVGLIPTPMTRKNNVSWFNLWGDRNL